VDSKKPEISVVLPTYNGSKFLDEAIRSVLGQTFTDFELIVVDDGSTDPEVRTICERYTDSTVYIYQENGGPSKARNTGLLQAEGGYICFLDQDDAWKPEKLELQLDFFKSIPSEKNAGLVFTWLTVIDESGNDIGVTKGHVEGNVFYDLFYRCIVFTPSSIMVKREVFDRVGSFDESLSYSSREDWDLYFRIAKHYTVYSLDVPLVNYRRHSSNATRRENIKKLESSDFKVLNKVFQSEKNDKRVTCMYDDVMAYHYLNYSAGYFIDQDMAGCRERYKKALLHKSRGVSFLFKLMYIASFFPKTARKTIVAFYRFLGARVFKTPWTKMSG
jgi:glycosyltransferase involved in cell wall biosynthesis